MSTKEVTRFRELLLSERGEIAERISGLNATLMTLTEREKEVEEQAQRITATQALNKLGAEGRVKMDLIDLALKKISIGEYGICEACGDDIAEKRLEALPWTRLCVDCAREMEKKGNVLPDPDEAIVQVSLPEEYAGLTDQQLMARIYDHIDRALNLDHSRTKVSVKKGAVYLEGSVEGQTEHELILQILTEEMELSNIVDTLRGEDTEWGEEEFGSSTIH